jgi:hypothetical protein
MRNAKIVFFLICITAVSTQTFRHFYVRFLDKDESIMDKYRSELEVEIIESTNLDQLENMYIEIDNEIKTYRENNKNDEDYADKEEYQNLLEKKSKITGAIRSAESLAESKYQLIIYWTMGFICILFGCLSYFFTSKWISFASLISGFSEMVVWTSPFFDRSNTLNFMELLNMKLFLSIITLVLITSVWLLNEKYIDKA